eukprot:7928023-Pyramimonas_sp.AAC.1
MGTGLRGTADQNWHSVKTSSAITQGLATKVRRGHSNRKDGSETRSDFANLRCAEGEGSRR